jgi:small-conductance mechanosensitive channel
VPNAKLSQSIVTNYYLPDRELAVVIDLIVDYGSDLDRVEEITVAVAREVMRTVPGGVSTFEPFVRFQALSDPGVAFTVTLRAKEFQDQGIIRHQLVKRLHRAYADAQITIPLKSLARQETPTEQPQR